MKVILITFCAFPYLLSFNLNRFKKSSQIFSCQSSNSFSFFSFSSKKSKNFLLYGSSSICVSDFSSSSNISLAAKETLSSRFSVLGVKSFKAMKNAYFIPSSFSFSRSFFSFSPFQKSFTKLSCVQSIIFFFLSLNYVCFRNSFSTILQSSYASQDFFRSSLNLFRNRFGCSTITSGA